MKKFFGLFVVCALSSVMVGQSAQAGKIKNYGDQVIAGVDHPLLDKKAIGNMSAVSTATQSADAAVTNGYCTVVSPGVRDQAGRYCSYGYSVFYAGYIVNDSCYSTANAAYDLMLSTRACSYSPNRDFGYCRLSQPLEKDINGRYCDKSYGVTYRNSILNNSCYYDIDNALTVAISSRACVRSTRSPRCQIAFPQERDANGRYCDGTYGVLYQGQILNNSCYSTLEGALALMDSTRVCNY